MVYLDPVIALNLEQISGQQKQRHESMCLLWYRSTVIFQIGVWPINHDLVYKFILNVSRITCYLILSQVKQLIVSLVAMLPFPPAGVLYKPWVSSNGGEFKSLIVPSQLININSVKINRWHSGTASNWLKREQECRNSKQVTKNMDKYLIAERNGKWCWRWLWDKGKLQNVKLLANFVI